MPEILPNILLAPKDISWRPGKGSSIIHSPIPDIKQLPEQPKQETLTPQPLPKTTLGSVDQT